MKYIKIFEQFLSEAKAFGAKEIMKELKNKDDWGDLADQVYMRGGNMVFVDTWYYGAGKAMKQLEDSWKKGGSNYDYWNKEYGVDFKIVDTFSEIKAEGRHKKLTKDGIVGVVLKVTPGKISEAKDYQNKMDLKDFKKIKKGSKIQYMGIPVKVLDNSGYVLKLKGEDGKIFVVNKGQFDHGGRIAEGTYNSKDHIGSTSDGQGSNAEIYKKGKGYYVIVSGEADYDFDAKNDKELLKKLKDNEFDSTDILEVNESSSKDGGDKSNGNSHHEDHKEKSIAQHWKDTYGEEFSSKYPAIGKMLKQRPGMDKRELKRIWDETYGENFEEQYPALYNKLD